MSAVATLSSNPDAFLAKHNEIHSGSGRAGASEGSTRTSAELSNLPRSASYTYIPKLSKGTIDGSSTAGMSEEDADETASKNTSTDSITSCESSQDTVPSPPCEKASESTPTIEKGELKSRRKSKTCDVEEGEHHAVSRARTEHRDHALSPRRSLSMLRRRSWKPSSHSPSRLADDQSTEATKDTTTDRAPKNKTLDAVRRLPFSFHASEPKTAARDESPSRASLSRKSTVLTKKSKKKGHEISKGDNVERKPVNFSLRNSVPAIPKSFSTDRLPISTLSPPFKENIPPVPDSAGSSKHRPMRLEIHRKKDELWTVFRTLDGDHQKFLSKSTALKCNVLRQTLLPFLKNYASNPWTTALRVEDLDRRCNILNKWWTALLELLHGRHNQSVSGTDRPAILDAIIGIMERPEWRLYPSPLCSYADRFAASVASRSGSSSSVASSSESDFLQESVHHNVRTIFVQNLIAQMGFVVDKMSLRSAPASLVTFCGKTCAYAFIFCPGVADLLARLWSPSLATLRRAFQLHGSSRGAMSEEARGVASMFPPCLQNIQFETAVKAFRELRLGVTLPLGTADVQWFGPWQKRWSGNESDLFYVFVKHYFVLVSEFLPPGAGRAERRLVPGLLLVEAQLLENLNATIHRNSTAQVQDDSSVGPSSITFDDVLEEPDAHASAMPMSPANATRLMAENRLIMLIRDFLSERNTHSQSARHIFAESFCDILKACAQRVSVYDHNACFTLCEFLEEALIILIRYEKLKSTSAPVLDWGFWISAWKGMTDSQNTTTEIRLYSLLYSIWIHILDDKARKEDLCLKFLLEPKFFESRFNHWCPMVRAYYMRLLVWRIARLDENMAGNDMQIHKALFERLKSTWSHYQYLKGDADAKGDPLLSTAPCSPAPGRRILIIRTDSPLSSTGNPFMSFDGIVPPSNPSDPNDTQQKQHSAISKLSESNLQPIFSRVNSDDSLDSELNDDNVGKKKWGFLRTLIGANKPRLSLAEDPDRSTPRPSSTNFSPSSSGTSTPTNGIKEAMVSHRSFCFKFSLEWTDRRYPFPALARIPPPRLPAPAQNALIAQLSEQGDIAIPPPAKPMGAAISSSRYSGRALAEWMIVVNECQNFFDRRLKEGVPSSNMVETPTLSFENFKSPR